MSDCQTCKGSGTIALACDQGHYGFHEKCPACDGTGNAPAEPVGGTDVFNCPRTEAALCGMTTAEQIKNFARQLERELAKEKTRYLLLTKQTCRAEDAAEKAEREVAGLRADAEMLECELGRRCYDCKQPIHPFEQKKMFNPAPSAASGGTWFSVHQKCPDAALKEPKND